MRISHLILKWLVNVLVCILLFSLFGRLIFLNRALRHLPFFYFFLYQFITIGLFGYMFLRKQKSRYFEYLIPLLISFLVIQVTTVIVLETCIVEIIPPYSYKIWIYVFNALTLSVLMYDFIKNRTDKLKYIIFVPISACLIFISDILSNINGRSYIIYLNHYFIELLIWIGIYN